MIWTVGSGIDLSISNKMAEPRTTFLGYLERTVKKPLRHRKETQSSELKSENTKTDRWVTLETW
jgi:hypothetical protein